MKVPNPRIGVHLSVLCLTLALGCGSPAHGEEPAQSSESGNTYISDGVEFSWAANATNLEIDITAPTTGWLAVGFEPTRAMKDADMVIGYIENGDVFLRDDFGDGFTSHTSDIELGGTDDVIVISGEESAGSTHILFSIPLGSSDEYDKFLEVGATVKVLLAYGPDDADNYSGYHSWAETLEIIIN